MTQSKEYSSMPLAVAIAGVIVLSAAGGWLLLKQDAATRSEAVITSAAIDTVADLSAPVALPAGAAKTATLVDVDAELRKARLAADADFIVSPPQRNAFYYYDRVLTAEPQHELATAELGVVLARVPAIIDTYLAQNDYDGAYSIAARVAARQPDHPVTRILRGSLDNYVSGLVALGEQYADDGDDDSATEIMSTLARLPGLNREYVDTSQSAILETMQLVESAAAQQALADEQQAEEQEISDWTQSVREAIATGQLLAPAGDSASDLLAARKTPVEAKKQLTKEFLAALVKSSEDSLDSAYLAAVETYLDSADALVPEAIALVEASADAVPADNPVENTTDEPVPATDASVVQDSGPAEENSETEPVVAVEPGPDSETAAADENGLVVETDAEPVEEGDDDITEALTALRGTVESQLIAAEEQRVLDLAEFVRLNNEPAEYPSNAIRRNVTGWVDVEFTVTKDGATANVEVRRAEPADVFEGSAIAAVNRWTFEPRQYRGQTINQRTAARLVFELE